MNMLKKEAAFLSVLFLLSAFVSHVCGFNVIRSSRLGSLEVTEVDNSLYNNETTTEESIDSEAGDDTGIVCRVVENVPVDIDLSTKFPVLNFNATWITRKYFWLSDDFNFESNYRRHSEDVVRSQQLVKVFILPHSHNDPGWINTYEQYYYRQTKHILDNAVRKLTELPHMTFVWSEITYLAKWWKEATPLAQEQFRKLVVDEGRLEIATAGWVVPDEATSSLYTLLSELTEGQQWVKNHLNTTAKYSWAIDPFGHSATHSHLLKQSSMQGMVIQRLHYGWKHWLAQHKKGEFRWRPRWDPEGYQDIPCLSLPFDLYSIKHACGPEPLVCLKFDFRSIQFEYGENYGIMTPVSKSNVRELAQEIVTQYYKTASLTKHNVLLVPLGDDFRYDRPLEWEQQYSNYMQLFAYINSHRDRFRMDIKFGTLRDYFEAVEEQNRDSEDEQRPTLSGDFFPYGDVYVSGRPAYWTGFYGTRPYWKKFHRELENELRSAEILFTYANMLAHKLNTFVEIKILSYKYKDLISARQDFSVFAHHDGITGTSRTWTMDDYGDRLHEAYLKCISVQQQSLKIIYQKSPVRKLLPPMLAKDFMRQKFELLPSKVPLEVFGDDDEYTTKIMIFNNLAWMRTELVKVFVKLPVVQVTDSKGASVPSQINPVFNHDERTNTIVLSERMYELVFLANLEPLATSVFKIKAASPEGSDQTGNSSTASVACENCINLYNSQFPKDEVAQTYSLESEQNSLSFQTNGLLESIHLKKENKSIPVELSFGMYKPTNKQSGAYLLKPLLLHEWQFFQYLNYSKPHLIRVSGPIMSQLISIHHDRYETIKVNTTLVNTETVPGNSAGPQGILLETYVDFSRDYSNRVEAYMRLDTGIKSTTKILGEFPSHNHTVRVNSTSQGQQQNYVGFDNKLVMYTDQNGFVCEKRLNVPSLGYEGNTYPVTTMAYIQDEEAEIRFSVLVDRTHGFNSMNRGRLETLIERKSLLDDGRGMSEGVTDSRPTVSTYVLLLENLVRNKSGSFSDWQPTLNAHKASLRQNYPPNLFVFNDPKVEGDDGQFVSEPEEKTISLISTPLPDNVHLLNLRAISSIDANDNSQEEAGRTALLNLQYLLDLGNESRNRRECNSSRDVLEVESDELSLSSVFTNTTRLELENNPAISFQMNYLNVTQIVATSLTGAVDGEAMNESAHVNLNRYGALSDRNWTELQRSSSLLLNFKLHFV